MLAPPPVPREGPSQAETAITPRAGAIAGAAFLGTLALVLVADRSLFDASLHEVLDWAANSLRVQEARHLELLTGNYSRVGFHHPGPAFLYVLAAGEALFHGWLGWVRSPVTGQALAAGLLAAAWMALVARELVRATGSRAIGLAASAAFLAITSARDVQYLVSIWFPYLYYLPFAVFTLAIARLASGRTDSLVPLCLSASFLVHGHASFIAIVAIMGTGALVAHFFAAGEWRAAGTRPYALLLWRRERRALITCLAVIALALLPIALDTVLHFPGEVPKYLGYRSGSAGNPWGPTLAFLSWFWGAERVFPILLAALATALLAIPATTRGIAIAIALATLATGFYAKTAIDHLALKYIGFYYFAAAALFGSALVALALRRLPVPQAASCAVTVAVALAIALRHLAPSNVSHDESVPLLAKAMREAPAHPVALDLDMGHDWQRLWGLVVGIGLESTRAGERSMCVNANWHILFTRRLRCTEEDLRSGYRMFATTAPLAPDARPGVLQRDGITFRPIALEAARPASEWLFTLAHPANLPLLVAGWSGPERDFTWSVGPVSIVELPMDKREAVRLTFVAGAYLPREDSTQSAEVWVNGVARGRLDFTAKANHAARSVDVPADGLGADGKLRIELRVRAPLSPAAAGQSTDPRPLGLSLRAISAQPAATR